jgi:hypothetical protein
MRQYYPIYLGVASFVYTLKQLDTDFECSLDGFITLYKPSYYRFTISAANRDNRNCGFIETDNKTVTELFNKSESKTIMQDCVKDYDDEKHETSHCSISKNEIKRGDILTTVDEIEFNCRLEKY